MQDQEIQEKLKRHRDHIRTEVASLNPIATTSQGRIMAGIELLLCEMEFRNDKLKALCRSVDMAADVVDFHEKYGINYDGPIREFPEDYAEFRNKRLQEELDEYLEAQADHDIVKQLDALVDLIYIALGNAHLQGFTPEIVNEAWKRVHLANMQKELSHEGNPGKYGALGDKRDIVKPPGWVAPDLTDLVTPKA